jgi:virginiamycin B lyase
VWFTESLGEKVGSITPAGTITEFAVPNAISNPHPRGITKGVDGRIWFAEDDGATVYSLTTSGSFSNPYPIPTTMSTPFQMALAADGSAWFIENLNDKVAQVQTGPGKPVAAATPGNGSATVTWTPPPTGGSVITGYTVDAYRGTTLVSSTAAAGNAVSANIGGLLNGAVYSFKVTATNAIGSGPPGATRLITIGMAEIAVPTSGSGMFYMSAGPDNRVWFAEAGANKLGASTAGGTVTEYPVTTPSSFPLWNHRRSRWKHLVHGAERQQDWSLQPDGHHGRVHDHHREQPS